MTKDLFKVRLRELMEKRNMSIVELAKKSGVHYVMINRYLSGDSKGKVPTIKTLAKLTTALNCTLEELTGIGAFKQIETKPTPQSVNVQKFLDGFASLTENNKAIIERMILALSQKNKEENK